MSRGPMHLGRAVLAGFLTWGSLACTLTSDQFTPEQVRAETLAVGMDGPESTPPAEVGDTDASGPECSNGEASGCELPFIAPDDECTSDLDCGSRVCASGSCALPSCADGRQNADESAVDCGGSCPARCSEGDTCRGDQDCQTGYFCPEPSRECAPASCADGARNGSEIAIDCGGGTCPGCPFGSDCSAGSDCASQICGTDGRCAAPTCGDGARNQDETDVDCGGGCEPCLATQGCSSASDCESAVCAGEGCGPGSERCCQAPSCDDGVRNGTEPNIDCGDASCGRCPIDNPCTADAQCTTNLCQNGLCRPQPCADGVENGSETDVDCGGPDPACRRCRPGDDCNSNTDCASGLCTGGACVNCFDGIRNGNETGTDCGGACLRCPGEECDGDNGCASGVCEADLCCGGDRVHCTRCASFLADELDCESNGDDATNDCEAFLQCLADNSDVCSVQSAPGCSDAACPYESFGGVAGPGVLLAAAILIDARCDL